MQTTIVRRTNGNTGQAHRGRICIKPVQGSSSRKKNHPGSRFYRTGFLKQPLKGIVAKPSFDGSEIEDCFTEDNFNFLLECAVHYAGLLGEPIETPAGSVHERISILYHQFSSKLPDGQGLNFDMDDGRLMWVVYHAHQWKDLTFYWMPVNFITMLSGQIREIALSFMNRFIRHNGLVRFSQGYEYEYVFESAAETLACNDYSEEESKDIEGLIQSYYQGDIAGLLDEVYDHKPVDVVKALAEYQPANPLESKLINCFTNGLPFLSGESIMSYDYDQYGSSMYGYDDEEPVTLDRIVRYVYETDDFVTNEIEYMTNQYCQNSYTVEPTSFMVLHPASKLFVPGDYPERFSGWFLEMIELTNEITGNE